MYTICCERLSDPVIEGLLFEELYSPVEKCFHTIDRIIEENFAPSLNIEDVEAEMFGEAKSNKGTSNSSSFTPNSVARKIGNAINTLIEKLKEMGKKLVGMFMKQDKGLDKMSADVKKAIREHPELKDQILLNAKEGSLMMRDLQDIQEFQKDYQKLKSETDPSKIKAGLAKLKHKWDDPENTKTLKRIGAAATVIGFATGLFVMVKKFDDAANVIKRANEDDIKEAQKLRAILRQEKINVSNLEEINARKLLLEFGSGRTMKGAARLYGHRKTLFGRCDKILNKISKGNYGKHQEKMAKRRFADVMAKAASGDIQDYSLQLDKVKVGTDEARDLQKKLKKARREFKYFYGRSWEDKK